MLGSSNKLLINQFRYLVPEEEKLQKMEISSQDEPASELCQTAGSQSVLKGDT